MINIAICDDDKSIIDTIYNEIHTIDLGGVKLNVSTFLDGNDLLKACKTSGQFNIVFMDIEIGGRNGIEIIEEIRRFDSEVIVIFVTSYPYYVVKALRVGAFQYLTKPIVLSDLKKDFIRAVDVYNSKYSNYRFQSNGNIIIKRIIEIYAIEVKNKKMYVYLSDKIYEEDVRSSLKEKEDRFATHHFVKCHKSYMVNMWKISEIKKDDIILKNGCSIPLSRNFRNLVLEKFNVFISRQKI